MSLGKSMFTEAHQRIVKLTTFTLLAAFANTAFAWNSTGHKATAMIAFERLLPDRQADIARILRAHPRYRQDFLAYAPDGFTDSDALVQAQWLFEQAAIWPDLVRDLDEELKAQFHRGSWHYVNFPLYLEDHDEQALADSRSPNLATEFNPPLRQNLNVIQALKGNLEVWQDANASEAEKAVALCWVLHLVGDLHQPLHNVALFSRAWYPEGDRGGNSVNVAWEPEPINLHAVWDGLPNGFENLEPGDLILDILRSDAATVTAIDLWPIRHRQLANVFVYTDDVKTQLLDGLKDQEFPAVELSEFYLSNATQIAREQVILAGHRIASFLE